MPSAEEPPILYPFERARLPEPGVDPEFPTRGSARPASRRVLLPQEYQRLVANPFLAVAGGIAWSGIFHFLPVHALSIEFKLGFFLSAFLLFFLPHYHCRDCGRTGWLFHWQRHACEAVRERQRTGRARRFRGPTPGVQLVVWFVFLLCAAIVGSVIHRGR